MCNFAKNLRLSFAKQIQTGEKIQEYYSESCIQKQFTAICT